jgi:cytochrome P450
MAKTMKGRPAPGPRGHPILGSLLDFNRNVVQALMDGRREYGDVVRFRVRFTAYLLAHPDHVKYVLQDNHRNYPHPPFMREGFGQVTGQGLVASHGDYWLRQRRLMNPAFNRQRIAAFGDVMSDTINERMDRWQVNAERGESLDIRVEMLHLALDILAKALFGTNWGSAASTIVPAAAIQLEHVYRRLQTFISVPEWAPVPSMRRFVAARKTIDDFVYGLIAERRSSTEESNDLITTLIRVRDEETGESMTDQQVRDEVMSSIIAGHETVSTGLTWIWYLLSKNPAVARRLRAELDEVLCGRPPTLQDLEQLRYTMMVVQEGLRLYPPLWVNARTPLEDDVIDGYHIEKGSFILLSEYVTHRHPDFWENAEGFDPERFTPERSAGRHRWAYVPFGGGPRKCIGMPFALMEIPLIVAMIAQRYRLDLVSGFPVALQPVITLRPRHGMRMIPVPVSKQDIGSRPEAPLASPGASLAPAGRTETQQPGAGVGTQSL